MTLNTDTQKRLLEAAKNNLLKYCLLINHNYKIPSHIKTIAKALSDVESGKIKRLIITLPPRHGKSMLVSQYFPAWFLGRNPSKYIITSTYGQELSNDFGRKVRDQLQDPLFQSIFTDCKIRPDVQSVSRVETQKGGSYFAVGAGGSLTGRGADFLLIDDPVKGREDADSDIMRQKLWEWYTSVAYTRLMPGGAVVIVMCMTGDTNVLMSDGTTKLLKEIKIGDDVASYKNGKIVKAKIINWINHGCDSVFEIRTSCGIVAKANKRHPFLVIRDGKEQWIRLKNLVVGDKILRVIGENGAELSANSMNVLSQLNAKDIATNTIIKQSGKADFVPHHAIQNQEGRQELSIDMELPLVNMRNCLKSKMENALAAESCRQIMSEHIGAANCASTIATKQEKLEDCFAMTATLQSVTEKQSQHCLTLQNTYKIIVDEIISIVPFGQEDVYDIQVEDTENFIANGLISHNTRWHEDDLVARVLANENKADWTVIKLQAIDDNKKPLWPEAYSLDALNDIRRTIDEYDWSCLYQQDPIPHGGIIFKPEWMRSGFADKDEYAAFYAAVDPAISQKEHSDETAICVVGLSYTNPATIHELETLHGHWTFAEQIKMIQAVHKKYNIDFFGIEDVAYQKSLIQECQRLWIPVTPLKANRDKVARAMSVSHFFSQGRVRVNTQDTRRQMLSFRGAGEKNDLADALIHAVGMVRDFSEERYLKEGVAKKETSHEWFYRMASQQEKEGENGVQEELYDKNYNPPSEDFY